MKLVSTNRCETDNWATTPFGCCPSMTSLFVQPHYVNADETDAKKILTASPWRTGGDHRDTLNHTTWMTIQQDQAWTHFVVVFDVQVTLAEFSPIEHARILFRELTVVLSLCSCGNLSDSPCLCRVGLWYPDTIPLGQSPSPIWCRRDYSNNTLLLQRHGECTPGVCCRCR